MPKKISLTKASFVKDRNSALNPGKVEFPFHVFPEQVTQLINEAYDVSYMDREFSAGCALSVFSGIAGNRWQVEMIKNSWTQGCALWVCIVGDAASKKSPTMKLWMKPIYELEVSYHNQYQVEMMDFERMKEGGMDDIKQPVQKEILLESTTMEGVFKVLKSNPNGVLMFADELASFIKGMDMYRKGGNDKEKWLSIYDNVTQKITRATQETKMIEKPFVAVLGGIQPAVIDSLASNSKDGDGFTYRFNFIYPDSIEYGKWTDKTISDHLIINYHQAISKLANTMPSRNTNSGHMAMSPEAKELWEPWYNRIKAKQNSITGYTMQLSVYNKMIGQCVRLAIILEAMKYAYSLSTGSSISGESMQGAIELSKYFLATSFRAHKVMVKIDDRIHRAADMYVHDELSMAEIGDRMRVSRQMVHKWKKSNPEIFKRNV